MKKTLLLISTFFFLLNINLFSQGSEVSHELPCATQITQQQLDYLNNTARQRQVFQYNANNKATIYIPVQNHIIRRTNGTGGLSNTDLSHIMLTLNHYYNEVNLVFYECGPVNYINNDSYYDFSSSQENTLASMHDVNNVINIYYFNSVTSGGNPVCGYSRFPPSPDRVIMVNSCALNGSTIVHEIGHYFSLYHTHGKTNMGTTNELVNGSNCTFAGDEVCDTPADPNLSGKVGSKCNYTGTATDLNGQFYNPQVSNIMSYASKKCRRTLTSGQYTRVAFSAQFDRNYLSCNPAAPVTDFSSNTQLSCQGKVSFFDRSSSLPNSWTWDFGDGTTSSDRNPVHFYKASGTYSVKLTSSNGSGAGNSTKTNYITIDLPAEPTIDTTDSICYNRPATLNGNATGNIFWYASDTLGTSLDSGNSYTTDSITASTTYYAANHVPNSIGTAGPANNSFGGGGNHNSDQHLIFDAYKPFQLQEVTVYSSVAEDRTIELRNFIGLVLSDTTVFVGTGQQVVTLNFDVPAGEDMQLGLSPSSEINLYRNNTSTSYPYDLPDVLSIKNSTAGTGYYYFFYNWKVKEEDCISVPVPVAVNVKNCIVGIETYKTREPGIYPNPNNGIFTVRRSHIGPMQVTVYNVVGKVVFNTSINNTVSEISMPDGLSGVYFVKFTEGNQTYTRKIVIH